MNHLKYFILLVFLVCFGQNLLAQETQLKDFKFGVNFGYAFYFEGELEKLNNQVVSALPFDVQTIDNFPPYYCYGIYVMNKMGKKWALGPVYSYYSTGSRLGAKDYSGSYSFDQVLSAHSLGIQMELLISEKEKSVIFFETIAGAQFANWEMDEKLIVGEIKELDSQKLKAVKPFIYPGFKFSWELLQNLSLYVKGGVSLDLAGKFYLEGNPKAKSDTKVNFSGPRITVGIEYGY